MKGGNWRRGPSARVRASGGPVRCHTGLRRVPGMRRVHVAAVRALGVPTTMQALREGLLAVATGASAAGVAGYQIMHAVWERADRQADVIDGHIKQLRQVSGAPMQAPTESPALPGFEARLRRTIGSAWNKRVWDTYESIRELVWG